MKWFFLLFFSFNFWSFSQAFHQIDSLKLLLKKADKEQRIEILNELSWSLKFSDAVLASQYAQQALELALKMDNNVEAAKAFYHLGVIHSVKGDFALSNQHANSAIKMYQDIDDARGIGKCINLQGINEQKRANYEIALAHYHKALDIFELLADDAYMLKIRGNIGNVNYLRGNYDLAIKAYQELVDFGRSHQDTIVLADNLANLGRSFSSMGYYDKALPIFFEGIELYQKINNNHGLANIYNDVGILYYTVKMYPESTAKYQQAIQLYQQLGNDAAIGNIYNNIGRNYDIIENYDSALVYFEKGLHLLEQHHINRRGNILTNIGKIKYKNGEKAAAALLFKQALEIDLALKSNNSIALHKSWLGVLAIENEEYEKAEKLLLSAHDIWTSIGHQNGLLTATTHLASLYEKKEDYKLALKYRDEYKLLEDSLFNDEQKINLMRVVIQQQSKEKEAVLAALKTNQRALEKSITQQLFTWQTITFSIVCLLGILLFSWFRLKKSRTYLQTKIRSQHLDLQSLESEKADLVTALEKKNQEVVFLSLSTIQRDNFIKQFSKKIKEVANNYPQQAELQQLNSLLHFNQAQQQNWGKFKAAFEQVSPGFFDALFQLYPNLSSKELRHCALIRLKFPAKDIAEILGISVAGVHKARYRLRKQLRLKRDQNLDTFLASI